MSNDFHLICAIRAIWSCCMPHTTHTFSLWGRFSCCKETSVAELPWISSRAWNCTDVDRRTRGCTRSSGLCFSNLLHILLETRCHVFQTLNEMDIRFRFWWLQLDCSAFYIIHETIIMLHEVGDDIYPLLLAISFLISFLNEG